MLKLAAFLALASALPAHASTGSSKSVSVATTEGPRPLETLRESIGKARKSKAAKKLLRAVEALDKRKHAEARKLLGTVQADPTLSDYGYFLAAESLRAEAAQKLEARKHAEARELARKAISMVIQAETTHAYSPLIKRIPDEIARAEILIADSYAGQKKWASNQQYFERALQRLSVSGGYSMIQNDSLESYARTCVRTPSQLCQAWLWKLAGIFPRNSLEHKALIKLSPDLADRATAPKAASRITQSYKTSQEPDSDAFEQAFALYLDGKIRPARKALEDLLEAYPRSALRFRARYWLAVTQQKDGDAEKARRTFEQLAKESPLSFYGVLGSLGSGKPVGSTLTATPLTGVTVDPFLAPNELFRLRRAELFLAEDLKDIASFELRGLTPRPAHTNTFLNYLAMLDSEAGNHRSAFIVLSELIQRGAEAATTQAFAKMVFPVAHLKLIEKYAAQFKVDPVLIISLMKQESAFDHLAASGVGAHGLMQLMPATAADTDPTIARSELTDPDTSVRLGVQYLKQMLDRYNGNVAYALAAYNAGPGAVNRWIRAGYAKPGMIEFIEQIPFKETRDYVGSILRNYFWYAPKLKQEQPKSLDFFWPAKSAPVAAPPVAPSDDTEEPNAIGEGPETSADPDNAD